MKKIIISLLILSNLVFANTIKIPTVVILVNFKNIKIGNLDKFSKIYYNKIFGKQFVSLNSYFKRNLKDFELTPAKTNTKVNSIIPIELNINHPKIIFPNKTIENVTKLTDKYIDYSMYDTNKDGFIQSYELNMIFILASGDTSTFDKTRNKIKTHSTGFDINKIVLDGVTVQDYDNYGRYSVISEFMFLGHKELEKRRSIGVIAHEVSHSLFKMKDMYRHKELKKIKGLMNMGGYNEGGNIPLGYSDYSLSFFKDFKKIYSKHHNHIH